MLQDDSEKALADALAALPARLLQPLADSASIENFGERWAALEKLAPTVTMFFEKVMVNTEDQALRANRLGLLAAVAGILEPYVDLHLLEGFSG
jgi:glycyl-tRNA synthetase beta subunit